MSGKRKDPFRTLDDPEPARTDEEIRQALIDATPPDLRPAGGYWRAGARPGWVRRLVVRVVLGWTWEPLV
jgi:hypothetical protein